MEAMISLKSIKKTYKIGDEIIEALKDISLNIYKSVILSLL